MSVSTDMLPKLSCAVAWSDRFLQYAGSPRARSHLQAKLTRIQKAYMAGDRLQLRYLIQQYLTSYDARFRCGRVGGKEDALGSPPKGGQTEHHRGESECFSAHARSSSSPADLERREHVSSDIRFRD